MAVGDFWNRIRRLFRQPKPAPQRGPSPVRQPTLRQPSIQPVRTPVVSPQPVVAPPTAPPAGPLEVANVIQMIHEAGRKMLLLQLTYDGVARLVEPYSFREKVSGRLFYGYCSIHARIHSFRPERITQCEITKHTFSPRWEIEL